MIDKARAHTQDKLSKYRKHLLRLALSGIFAAAIFVFTQIRFPTAIGYVNLGDGFILGASFLLGPWAFFPAAIGSALADLMAGYPVYIPATFLIKGIMGLVAGILIHGKSVGVIRKLSACIIAELIMVIGYFGFEALPFMYGPTAAAGSVIPNLVQAAAGALIGFIMFSALRIPKERLLGTAGVVES
ncbi:MAG: ECF transporter S component [Clostridiaceae bacterium]|nr:ECF transporter S component [Clostridiaceae bacterium]